MCGNRMRVWCWLAVAGACGGLLSGAALSREGQQTREALTTLGILTCSVSDGKVNPAAPGREVLCRFRPGLQGSEETYAGTLQGVGQVAALLGKGTVMLEVKGPAGTSVVPGLLQQAYSAVESSSVSAAAPLIGAANSAIVLQPLTEEEGRVAAGKARPDAAIIMVELKLRSSPG